MELSLINNDQLINRAKWVKKLSVLSGDFGVDASKVETEMQIEIRNSGENSLLGHLRLCGVIPENYGHDTSEEKLYSKYTDIVIHEAYLAMGFNSCVIKERADVADVECITDKYSFVADAKAFRLSRTAKNQKDFKIQAMDNWKHGKPYAMVIAPIYQLPTRSSQIYLQAATRSVCVCSYTHLAVLVRYSNAVNQDKTIELLHNIFKTIERMNPSKNAIEYWQLVNNCILNFDVKIRKIWQDEKKASIESIHASKKEALTFVASERERIMKMSKDDAIKELLLINKIDNKIKTIETVTNNGLMENE